MEKVISPQTKTPLSKLLPVMLCFFAMGFVDLVGIASNYVKHDLSLSDAEANIFPSLVFFWFLIFSVPTGLLMNRIGRKRTVLLSLAVTALSLLMPLFGSGYYAMLFAFSLLGIGNAIMQTSLNPLLSSLVSGDRLASTLTFGQFVKAIASFLAPYLAMWGSMAVIPSGELGWRVLFPIYLVVSVLAIVALGVTDIKDERAMGSASGIKACLVLLRSPFILLCFLGIMCHVGIDVGVNTTAPKILMERLGFTLDEAAFATSVYFIFRTIGCLSGSVMLAKIQAKPFLLASVVIMLLGAICLFVGQAEWLLLVGVGCLGLGNSNVFSVVFAQALLSAPDNKNEVSGLMIMGLFGGTIFPLLMGLASDAVGQVGAVAVITIGIAYLLFYTTKVRE